MQSEVVAIKDVTNDFPISLYKVYEALDKAGFGKIENDLIQRTLMQTGVADID